MYTFLDFYFFCSHLFSHSLSLSFPSPSLSPSLLQPVRAELMQALWSTLHNPYDNVATVAYRVLGKFGGSNRKMLSTPQPVSTCIHTVIHEIFENFCLAQSDESFLLKNSLPVLTYTASIWCVHSLPLALWGGTVPPSPPPQRNIIGYTCTCSTAIIIHVPSTLWYRKQIHIKSGTKPFSSMVLCYILLWSC